MKTTSANMITHLGLSHTTLNTCWKYVRATDSAVYGFTDHDASITYDSVTYSPLAAGNLSNLRQSNRLNVDNQDVEAPFASGAITAAALRSGLWNNAAYYIFLINPNAVADGIIKLTSGRLGEIEIRDYIAKLEHRSMTQLLSTPILRLIVPECNASLGDTRCGVALGGYTHTAAILAVTGTKSFTLSGAGSGKADGYYSYGKATWTSGLNSGFSMQVQYYASNTVTLFTPMPYTITAGDGLTMIAGCNRLKTTCISTFNNVINFRGFDKLPGIDKIVVIPNNRRWVTDS